MANSKIYNVLEAFSIAISTAFFTLRYTVIKVLNKGNGWLETYAWPPLDFRETWLFRHHQRLQMAIALIQLNMASLTVYWRRQHHRRVKRNAGWHQIEKPIHI